MVKNLNEFQREEISRLNNGEIETFRLIFNREASLLRSFAEKFIDRSSAQDLVQDVFLKLWINRKTLQIKESIRAYLFQAVRNSCINYLEHQKVKITLEDRLTVEEQIREVSFFKSPEQLLVEKEQLDSVFQAIENLPEKSREVFKLAYFENKKSAEIAEMLHLSIRTVETQIYKSLKTIRERLVHKN